MFARYLVSVGTLRFLIEFVRVNARVAGPFTLAQIFSSAIAIMGLLLMFVSRGQEGNVHG